MEYIILFFFLWCIIFACISLYVYFRNLPTKSSASSIAELPRLKPKPVNAASRTAVIAGLKGLPFWLYFIAFTAAELLTALIQPLAGVICHGIILTTLLILSAFTDEARSRNFTIALALVPLIRIMSLSMPLANVPQIYWYIMIYVPLLVATVFVMRIVGLTPRQVGWVAHGLPLQIAVGVVTGVAFGIVEYLILRPQPLVAQFSVGQVWFPALVLFLTVGPVEEFIFRGVLQQTSEPVLGRLGLVYVSAIFAIMHVGNLSVVDIIFVFGVALFFAAFVKKTGSLVGVSLSHGLTNVVVFLIAPFLLS